MGVSHDQSGRMRNHGRAHRVSGSSSNSHHGPSSSHNHRSGGSRHHQPNGDSYQGHNNYPQPGGRSSRSHRTSRDRHRINEYNHYKYGGYEDYESVISPCVKYSLFFFNFVFWLLGIAMIGIGAWSFAEEVSENGYSSLLKVESVIHLVLHVSLAIMIIGGVIFLMSFAGCLGALRENLCLLKLYSYMLLILFIGEVILSTVAFVFPNAFLQYFKDNLSKDLTTKYRSNGDANLQNIIDGMQMTLKCCGLSGHKDWHQNMYFNCNATNIGPDRCGVPYSCCRPKDEAPLDKMCGNNIQSTSSVIELNKSIYTRGCIDAFTEVFERNMNLAASLCLGCALVQLFAIFLSRSLQGQIDSQRARWV